jgi:iron(III) transport system substrate-binding protein
MSAACVLIAAPAMAQAVAADQAALVEGARREGRINVATSAPAAGFHRFLAAFREKYPFIETDAGFQSAPSATIAARVEAEIASSKLTTDIIHTANLADFIRMEKAGQLLRYDLPEYKEYPKAARSPGFWASARAIGTILAYNKNVLGLGRAPRTWSDLLKPGFSGGKIAIKNVESGTLFNQMYLLEQRFGGEFLSQLAAQKPVIMRAEKMIDALAERSIEVAAAVDHWRAFTPAAMDGGIAAVYPREGMPLTLAPIAILAGAPHPNAAKLLLAFALSREGQLMLNDDVFNSYSMHPDVPSPPDLMPLAEARPLLPLDLDDYVAASATFPERFKSLFAESVGGK